MADRRMFSQKVVGSDDFTAMPAMAQLLYFHLAMEADDDGFLNCQRRIRLSIGATEDDMLPLFQKGYIIQFDAVLCIAHWHMHNQLRKDRHKETIYQELKAMLKIENKVYILADNQLSTTCSNRMATIQQPNGNPGKERLDENRLGQFRLDEGRKAHVEVLARAFDFSPALFSKITEWISHKEAKKGAQTDIAITKWLGTVKSNVEKHGEDSVSELIDTMIMEGRTTVYFDRLAERRIPNEGHHGEHSGDHQGERHGIYL